MSALQDAKLTLDGPVYDISVADDGDIETEDSFDTMILNSVFTDARASKDQITTPERRRGWIGSQGEDFILGNTAWVYGQLRNRQAELNELAGVYRLSLEHMVEQKIAIKITSSILVEDAAILSIRIERPNNQVDYRHYTLWENTGT